MLALRRIITLLAAAVMAFLATGGVANAAPSGGSEPTVNGKELPEDFPEDLYKFVGGTDEFKDEWFDGECATRGGDFGSYLAGTLQSRDGRPVETFLVNAAFDTDWENSFPNGDSSFFPQWPMCADDLKRFADEKTTTWGFSFVDEPDQKSKELMLDAIEANSKAKYYDAGTTDDYNMFTDAVCEHGNERRPAQLCLHQFYLDCEKAEDPTDAEQCFNWNSRVGELQGGAYYWWDQNRGVTDRISGAFKETGSAFSESSVSAWDAIWSSPIGTAVKFIADPGNVIDDWANSLKDTATDLSEAVIRGLVQTGTFDPTNSDFLKWYAYSTGIGMVVMAITAILAMQRSSDGKRDPAGLASDFFGYLPAGMMMMLFAPGAAQLLVSLADALSEGIGSPLGMSADEAVSNVSSVMGDLTSDTIVGGAIAGIVVFVLVIIGVCATFFGLLMHAAALPILSAVAGIGFGMWVHPKWREKALRPVMVFIGMVFMKPLLLLMLGVVFTTVNIWSAQASGSSGLDRFAAVGMIGVCFVLAGLAPWAMLKYAPILPTSADSAGFGSGGSTAGMAISSTGSYMMGRSGGGGGAGRFAQAAQKPSTVSAGAGVGSGGGGGGGKSAVAGASPTTGKSASASQASQAGGKGKTGRIAGTAARVAGGPAGKALGTGARLAKAATPFAVTAAGTAMNKSASAAQQSSHQADGSTTDG